MNARTVTKVIAVAGALLVVGFFLRWFGGDGFGFVPATSGFDIARFSEGWDRFALFGIPIGGAAMIWGAFKSPMAARRAAFFTGLFILGYAVICVARVVLSAFQHVAGVGLWLVAVGAFAAFVVPLVVKSERRE